MQNRIGLDEYVGLVMSWILYEHVHASVGNSFPAMRDSCFGKAGVGYRECSVVVLPSVCFIMR